MASGTASRKAPKPRAPARARATAGSSAEPKPEAAAAGRPSPAELALRLDRLSAAVSRVEAALSPATRSADVAAEEHALLNLLDSIVDRRTEALLLPVARLAASLERARAAEDERERTRLLDDAAAALESALEALGLERIRPARGDPFEPPLHEQVDEAPADELDPGLVAALVRAGYRVRGGRVLVPARVTVS